ncbi:hypothetical protein [Methanosarcina acetivorans]|uniref:hypothetical protein n=1 Tax=Methanosarcina acetivorans TaxID=2214 RepID=UPI0012FF5726|nr:hypothetical protein [Methanosarcina acetivorans]
MSRPYFYGIRPTLSWAIISIEYGSSGLSVLPVPRLSHRLCFLLSPLLQAHLP